MASLTEISIISRKIIRYSIYTVILIIIARFSINIGGKIYKILFPPKPEPPTVSFGKLSAMPFPERPKYDFKYKLELPEGKLPIFPDRAEVYKMPKPQSNIKVLDNAKTKAQSLGFDPNGRLLDEKIPNVYIFSKKGLPSSLTMNIITGLFSISYNLEDDPLVLRDIPPSAEAAIAQALNFLNAGGLLNDDLRNGKPTHLYLKVEGGKFIPAVSLSDAQITKVNIFRKAYGKDGNLVAVTPKMPQANIWFIISGGRGKQIIAGEYHYYPVDKNNPATYPIITSDQAWEELTKNNAFIANPGENPDGNITIRKVYLGYYDPGQYSEYYQPVVVFEGDNDFYAYVPAVTSEYYPK